MDGMSDGTVSQIGDGVSGHFDERGSLQFGRGDPGGTVVRIVQRFISPQDVPQFLLDAVGTVAGLIVAWDATVPALETGFAGFFETTFV